MYGVPSEWVGVAEVAWDVLQVRSWRAGLLLAVIPMDPGVPLHLGLPLILKASVSAQLEQAMRVPPQRKSSLPVATLQELVCGEHFPREGWSGSGL